MQRPAAPNFTTKLVNSRSLHPFQWVVNSDGQKGIGLTFQNKLIQSLSIQEFENISISIQPDKKTILIMLSDEDKLSQFFLFSEDLIESVERNCAQDSPSILNILEQTAARWVQLFKIKKKGFTETVERGLIGELLVLRDILLPNFNASECVFSWNGPKSHEQDFLINSKMIEVKCQLASSDKIVKISSLEQLDIISGDIFLAHIGIGDATNNSQDTFSLTYLTDDIVSKMSGDNYAIDALLKKMELVGYYHGTTQSSRNYSKVFEHYFEVTENFPRIARSSVSQSIGKASYSLNTSQLDNWEIGQKELIRELTK